MPSRFLTDAERARLGRYPADVPIEDLIAHFTLTAADLTQVRERRGDANRLGFSLQLGALRAFGFCPDDVTTAPSALVRFVADQLGVLPEALGAYGERAQTRTDHVREIQQHLGFRTIALADWRALARWLVERALEHDTPSLLFQLAAEHLYAERVVRPGVTRLERLVVATRRHAEYVTYQRLRPLLTDERQTLLDGLLVVDAATGQTPLAWLRRGATSATPAAILETIDKLTFVRRQGVADWDLAALNPNRRKFLAQLGRRATNQALQRTAPRRRYPILVAFLRQTLEEVTDELVDLFDRCLAEAYARARRDLEEFRLASARSVNEKLHLLRLLTGVVLDPLVPDDRVRAGIFAQTSPANLQAAADDVDRLARPLDDHYFDFLAARYAYLRQFAPALLAALTVRSSLAVHPLIEAIVLLRRLNAERRRVIPADWDVPLDFVPARWRPYLYAANGRVQRPYYELCALWELRGALRAGDLWLEGSRRYANPDSYLIPRERWPALRAEVCRLVGVPADGAAHLRRRQEELQTHLADLERRLPDQDAVRIVNGDLVLTPLAAEVIPPSAEALQDQITARLPLVELIDLLIEADRWTGFSRHLTHAAGSEPRTPDLLRHLYAAILAQACNIGLTKLAEIADLSYRQLAWVTTWYLREETLRAAVAAIVNYHYHLPLSQAWGGGTLSSSDGQRFPVAVKTTTARALPRYFGHGRGLTFYSWTSDQNSQYGSKPAISTLRDSTYVLDAIMDNETELPILEHATDTSGFTEIVFSLFGLLGLQFSPRIRDLGDQRLYRLDRERRYPALEPLLSGTLNQGLIVRHWDDLLRVAGSIKLGWVTASLLIGKLQSYPRQNQLTRAFQEYGRLEKTLFIVRYLASEEYRRRINRQLNKGERLHALRQFLLFANEGKLRRRHLDEQINQASCLNLMTNAVITWNTVYMQRVIETLRAEGHRIDDADLPHLSPARFEHINPYGRYVINVEAELSRTELRPLRPAPAAEP